MSDSPDEPAMVPPSAGEVSEAEMARWSQYVGVRRMVVDWHLYKDQYMLVRAQNDGDARSQLGGHGFKYCGALAFRVPFETAPAWLINLSLFLGRFIG